MNMQQNDDEKFESFLKQFRPREPEPLQTKKHGRAIRRPFVFAAWATVAASIVAAVLTIQFRPKPTHPPDTENLTGVEQLSNQQPLTIGSANALLAQAPSVQAAVDALAFHSQTTRLSKGKHSALGVLSKENIKL